MDILGLVGLLLSIAILIFATYKGVNLFATTLVCTILIALTSRIGLWTALQSGYAKGFSDFVCSYFFVFTFGVLFGEVLGATGVAEVLGYTIVSAIGAKRAVLGVILINFLMGTCGINGYVMVFATVPITKIMFKKAGLPMRIMPGIQMLGATLGCGLLPYNPIIVNVIPTNYLGTTLAAAPMLGIISWVALFVPGYIYSQNLARKSKSNLTPEELAATEADLTQFEADYAAKEKPSFAMCLIPCVLVVATLVALNNAMNPNACVTLALTIGIIACMAINWKRVKGNYMSIISKGLVGGAASICLASTVMGYGQVVQMTPAFVNIVALCLNLALHPYITEIIAVNLLAGITASCPGGINIFMQSLGTKYVEMGYNAQVIHKLSVIAGSGLNSLPHSPSVIMSLDFMKVSFKEGYWPVFVTSAILPTVASIITCIAAFCGIV